jgi:predicted nucleic acid-binding protein
LSVIDASVLVDALVTIGPLGDAAEDVLASQPIVEAPAILKAEALSAVRRLEQRGELPGSTTRTVLDQLGRLGVRPYHVDPLLERIWELRDTLSTYDAWYVALAEELDTDLVTTDRRLATASGPRCPITVVTG